MDAVPSVEERAAQAEEEAQAWLQNLGGEEVQLVAELLALPGGGASEAKEALLAMGRAVHVAAVGRAEGIVID